MSRRRRRRRRRSMHDTRVTLGVLHAVKLIPTGSSHRLLL
jgi:hypothetical protein